MKGVVDYPLTERLAILAEECGEVVQVIGKILRHGPYSRHPANLDGPTNIALLERELGDVQAALHLLTEAGDVGPLAIREHQEDKLERLLEFVHTQENRVLLGQLLRGWRMSERRFELVLLDQINDGAAKCGLGFGKYPLGVHAALKPMLALVNPQDPAYSAIIEAWQRFCQKLEVKP